MLMESGDNIRYNPATNAPTEMARVEAERSHDTHELVLMK